MKGAVGLGYPSRKSRHLGVDSAKKFSSVVHPNSSLCTSDRVCCILTKGYYGSEGYRGYSYEGYKVGLIGSIDLGSGDGVGK